MTIKVNSIFRIWFYLLLLSFAYEKPVIIISNMDRINPRLFDLVSVFGLFILPYVKKPAFIDPIFGSWKSLIIWFGVCSLLSIVLYQYPVEINQFIIFYYFKYLQGLLVIFLITRIPPGLVSLKTIFRILIVIGVFLTCYCIYEIFYGQYGEIEFAPGKYTKKPLGVVWGPFGNTYFQIANYLPFIFISIFGLAHFYTGIKKYLMIVFSLILTWPLFLTGSRTGLGLLVITFIIFIIMKYKSYKIAIILVLFALIVNSVNKRASEVDEVNTLSRLQSIEEDDNKNSIVSRMLYFVNFDISSYSYNGILVPIIGGGFYVAPVNGEYRIGYGFHNIYIFSLEQSGLIGIIFYLLFIKIS